MKAKSKTESKTTVQVAVNRAEGRNSNEEQSCLKLKAEWLDYIQRQSDPANAGLIIQAIIACHQGEDLPEMPTAIADTFHCFIEPDIRLSRTRRGARLGKRKKSVEITTQPEEISAENVPETPNFDAAETEKANEKESTKEKDKEKGKDLSPNNSAGVSNSRYPRSESEVLEIAKQANVAFDEAMAAKYFAYRQLTGWIGPKNQPLNPDKLGQDMFLWFQREFKEFHTAGSRDKAKSKADEIAEKLKNVKPLTEEEFRKKMERFGLYEW